MDNPTQSLAVAPEIQAPALAPIAGAPPKIGAISMGHRGIELSSFDDAWRLSKAILASGLAPKAFGSQEAILIAIQFGAELGLPPMSALQNIAVIQGRPTVWGDAVPGICNASGLMEDYKQEMVGTIGEDGWGYRVTIRRKGRSEAVVGYFDAARAKAAGLWGKPGPWQQYPDRMLLNRARTFACRDAFPDVMRGLVTAEEAGDHPQKEKNVTGSLASLE